MVIYDVDIPEIFISNTIKKTRWDDFEPITSFEHINPKWLGSRPSQVQYSLVKVLLGASPQELQRRVEATLLGLRCFLEELTKYGDPSPYLCKHLKLKLLADLRYIYLLKSFLVGDDWDRFHSRHRQY